MSAAWTVGEAQRHAREGKLEDWVHAYLAAGNWANPGLFTGLRRQRRWWRGPLETPLHALERVCGPEAWMEYREDPVSWAGRIAHLTENLKDPMSVPPLIAEYRGGRLSVRDGSHRLEAMRRLGWSSCWIVVWYNSEDDVRSHAG